MLLGLFAPTPGEVESLLQKGVVDRGAGQRGLLQKRVLGVSLFWGLVGFIGLGSECLVVSSCPRGGIVSVILGLSARRFRELAVLHRSKRSTAVTGAKSLEV